MLLYLVRLADVIGCDLTSAANTKLDAAALRYPAVAFHGTAPVK